MTVSGQQRSILTTIERLQSVSGEAPSIQDITDNCDFDINVVELNIKMLKDLDVLEKINRYAIYWQKILKTK